MILPSFTIEFDPDHRPVASLTGDKKQLYGALVLTLNKVGKPRHAVSFSKQSPTRDEWQEGLVALVDWAEAWMEEQRKP